MLPKPSLIYSIPSEETTEAMSTFKVDPERSTKLSPMLQNRLPSDLQVEQINVVEVNQTYSGSQLIQT